MKDNFNIQEEAKYSFFWASKFRKYENHDKKIAKSPLLI